MNKTNQPPSFNRKDYVMRCDVWRTIVECVYPLRPTKQLSTHSTHISNFINFNYIYHSKMFDRIVSRIHNTGHNVT